MSNENTESTVDIFQRFLDSRLADVHTAIPGKIVSYDANSELAKVQPVVKLQRQINNTVVSIEIPPIENVPVLFLTTSSFRIKTPIKKDDGVMIFFSEVGIGDFLNSSGAVSNPEDSSRFSLTDAVCIPGLWGKNHPTKIPTIELTDQDELKLLNTVLSLKDGEVSVLGGKAKITNTTVNLLGATQSFTKGEALETLLDTLLNSSWMSLPPGTQVQNAAILTALIAAANAASALVTSIKSTTIKGE